MHCLSNNDGGVSILGQQKLSGIHHPITTGQLKVSIPQVLLLPAEEMTVIPVELI